METPLITKAQQIKDIIEPIPAEMFLESLFGINPYSTGKYNWLLRRSITEKDIGKSCFLGHIHRTLSPIGRIDFNGDGNGYGARQLTKKFLSERHKEPPWIDGAYVNNNPTVNGYTEPVIKDRVMHLINDMIEAGY